MIAVYSGTPGSGKSYNATRQGLEKISRRRKNKVVANFAIKEMKNSNRWLYQDEIIIADLVEMSKNNGWYGNEGSALLIVDEAANIFNARDWQQDKQRREWLTFFAQHRKLGFDIILVSIDLKMLDRQIRTVAENDVKHVKLRNHWLFKYFPVPVFLAVNYWLAGQFKGRVSCFRYKKKIGNAYDTYKMFSSTGLTGTLTDARSAAGTNRSKTSAPKLLRSVSGDAGLSSAHIMREGA